MEFSLNEAHRMLLIKSGKLVENSPKNEARFFRQFFRDDVSVALGTDVTSIKRGRPVMTDEFIDSTDWKVEQSQKASQGIIIPPTYRKSAIISAYEGFQRVIGDNDELFDSQTKLAATSISTAGKSLERDIMNINGDLDRTEELMCSQAILDRQVTLNRAATVNFNHDASTKLAYNAANDFGIDTVDPERVFRYLASKIVDGGMVSPSIPLIALMGIDAVNKLINNPFTLKRNDIKNYEFGLIEQGLNQGGVTPWGMVSYGSFRFILTTYNVTYDHPVTGAKTPFMPADKLCVMPQKMDARMFYGGTPKWVADYMVGIMKGKRTVQLFKDERAFAVEHLIQSRPIPILENVDQIATAVVVNPNNPN